MRAMVFRDPKGCFFLQDLCLKYDTETNKVYLDVEVCGGAVE